MGAWRGSHRDQMRRQTDRATADAIRAGHRRVFAPRIALWVEYGRAGMLIGTITDDWRVAPDPHARLVSTYETKEQAGEAFDALAREWTENRKDDGLSSCDPEWLDLCAPLAAFRAARGEPPTPPAP